MHAATWRSDHAVREDSAASVQPTCHATALLELVAAAAGTRTIALDPVLYSVHELARMGIPILSARRGA